MSCGINSFKNRIAVNQSVKVKDGSGGFELNSTLLLTVWSMVEATEEKPEEIDEGRNTRSVWYDVTTRLSPMLDTLHRLNSLFFVVDGGKTIYPKSYKIKGNLVTFRATYSYNDSVIPVYSPIAAPSGWNEQIAEYGRGYRFSKPSNGTDVQYRVGDDNWAETNIIRAARLSNTLKTSNTLKNFFELNYNNEFGHTWRFTNKLGDYHNPFTNVYYLKDGTVSTIAIWTNDGYAIDNYTGYGLGLLPYTSIDWNDGIDNCLGTDHGGTGTTVAGYDDFFAANLEQFTTLQPNDLTAAISRTQTQTPFIYSPLNAFGNVFINNVQSSTTHYVTTTSCISSIFRTNIGDDASKTGAARFLKIRKHF